jgi:hypothetical protein
MWPILPPTTMSMPFIEMPQRDEALPSITSRPPWPVAPAYWLASPLTDRAGHHVLGDARAGRPVDGDRRPPRSCRRSSSRRGPRTSTVTGASTPTATECARGLARRNGSRWSPAGNRVQAAVEFAQGRSFARSSRHDRPLSCAGQASVRPRNRRSRARAPRCGLLDAGQVDERAVFGAEGDVAVGLGHHGRLAGDRVAQHAEAVLGADDEGEEAVEIVEAPSSASAERRLPSRMRQVR